MIVFILIGVESSGNHLFCTLFSKLEINGNPVIGTDMLGWDDGRLKNHDEEFFDSVWKQENTIPKLLDSTSVDRMLVTSRSIPCGKYLPDLNKFAEHCDYCGHSPNLIAITRDLRSVELSIKRRNMFSNPEINFALMDAMIKNYNYRIHFISYECLVRFKQVYFDNWFMYNFPHLNFKIPDKQKYFDLIIDQNKKYKVD